MDLHYFNSKVCEQMLFNSQEDVDYFDNVITNYLNNKVAINEFNIAMNLYPSLEAIQIAINNNEFHLQLNGKNSDELILACENMVAGIDLNDDECYICAMNYIFHNLYKNLIF